MKPKKDPYSPFLLIFTSPKDAAEQFLHRDDSKNIALFLFLLSAFCSLFGQYPRVFFEAMASLCVLFGGSFLYVFFFTMWEGKFDQKRFWTLFSSLSLAQIPMIFGRIIISFFLFIVFGKIALYEGVQMLIDLPSDSLIALFLFFGAVVFSTWSLYAEIRILSHIQKIKWGYALVRILISSLLVTFLSLLVLSLFSSAE